ncbi:MULTISPECIES: dihydrolipoamide acetyltransferase family protein [unclassified Meridianimarinicoccus]|uniref:dihydrolipoamide acetyltransferase family protein n=1 Tax=unclassified Meridianimarinicoccus TaxID=2923344 RepID=UPI001866B347|nr:dihydrolipoamide acetyltransferase family protein [Fluviibacterium sp. MJW13]
MKVLPVKLPDVGEGVTEAELVEWHVKVGDIVREDDVIAAVMTDKATVEIPSLYSGKITELAGEIGQVLPIGTDLVMIETEADAVEDQTLAADPGEPAADKGAVNPETTKSAESKPPAQTEKAAKPVQQTRPRPVAGTSASAPRTEGALPLAAPSVRARARDGGIDLRQVPGTGPAGRITHQDLDAVFSRADHPAASSGPGLPRSPRIGSEDIPVVGMRRKIAERMALANARIPHITVVEEVDVTALEDLRAKLNDSRGERPKLTLLPFLAAVLARALPDHPEMNAHYDDEAGVITRHAGVNLGMATMTDAGLVVPVLRHVEALGLYDIATEIARLSEAARTSKARREELTGSTITVTSLGPLGALATTPIINPPEVAILGVNKIATRPMWDGTQFVPRKMMNISASFDHRVIDGWNAAVFVQKIKSLLETPALIFVEV